VIAPADSLMGAIRDPRSAIREKGLGEAKIGFCLFCSHSPLGRKAGWSILLSD
jgi:hypothetical protein